jgi:anthranilate synthase component 2
MILLIDNYDSFTYNLYQLILKNDVQLRVVRNDKITLEEIKQLKPKAIVLSPGPGRPEDAGICVDVIKQFASSIPILGVCLGHQAIGIAFGGKVVQADEIMHGKPAYVFHQHTSLYKNMPLPFVAGRYHSLIVEKKSLPAELLIEAENSDGIIMGIKHRDYPTYGVQFHPESILTPEGNNLIKQFIKDVIPNAVRDLLEVAEGDPSFHSGRRIHSMSDNKSDRILKSERDLC